jgi:hypothetical protein
MPLPSAPIEVCAKSGHYKPLYPCVDRHLCQESRRTGGEKFEKGYEQHWLPSLPRHAMISHDVDIGSQLMNSLSRPLAQNELSSDATEALEQARTVAREPLPPGRTTGTERKAGTAGKPTTAPSAKKRPEFKLPPFDPPGY